MSIHMKCSTHGKEVEVEVWDVVNILQIQDQ
jgi:hypothetical protein